MRHDVAVAAMVMSALVTCTLRGTGAMLVVTPLAAGWGCAPPLGGEPALPHDTTVRQPTARLCDALPPASSSQVQAALIGTRSHARHVWRDTPPFNADGSLNGYVEISLGDRRKWEFDIGANRLRLDRTLDVSVGGYPVNYGFVPQTASCDGDPFDVLVLGAPIPSGTLLAGEIVGVMYMDDEKGPDGKVIIAPQPEPDPEPNDEEPNIVTAELEARLRRWFDGYKAADAARGRWSAVRGFGGADEGRQLVELTHGFYRRERERQPQR
jgi:inorganic pyrophosphatase